MIHSYINDILLTFFCLKQRSHVQTTKLHNYPKNKKRAQKVQQNWNAIRNIYFQKHIWVKHRNYYQETVLGKHMYTTWTFLKFLSISTYFQFYFFLLSTWIKILLFKNLKQNKQKCLKAEKTEHRSSVLQQFTEAINKSPFRNNYPTTCTQCAPAIFNLLVLVS